MHDDSKELNQNSLMHVKGIQSLTETFIRNKINKQGLLSNGLEK